MSFTPPDWRDESNYPDPKEATSLNLWAWEFLRRNKDYQKDWDEHAARLRSIARRVPQLDAWIERLIPCVHPIIGEGVTLEEAEAMDLLLREQPELYLQHRPARPVESLHEWRALAEATKGGDERSWCSFLGEKWGLGNIINPGIAYSWVVRFLNCGATIHLGEGGLDDDCEPPFGSPECIFTGYLYSLQFDLRLPKSALRAQFEAILATRDERIGAKHFVPFAGRPEKSLPNFRNYLRTLDALDAGVTVREIAEIMLPHYDDAGGARKTVDNWKTRAIAIRDSEYASLPAYEEIPATEKVKER